MILVTGATGNIGSEVLRRVLASAEPVRLLTREPTPVAAIQGRADVTTGDFTVPATLDEAFRGVDRAFLVFSGGETLPELAPPVLEVAKRAGVKHVVLVSSGTISYEPPVAIGRWHLAAEQVLQATGVAWTMLRPGNFASNALRWAGSLKARGTVFVPHGSRPSSPIDPIDIGAVAAACLLESGHEEKVYNLNGPEVLTAVEQVRILGEVVGKRFTFIEVPPPEARSQMIKYGLSAVMADAVLELTSVPPLPDSLVLDPAVAGVTGRPAGTFEAWARRNAAAFS